MTDDAPAIRAALGVTGGSLNSLLFDYYKQGSGLTAGTLSDHRIAYYRKKAGVSGGTANDLRRQLWGGREIFAPFATYRWTGATNASTSTEVANGVTRTNWCTDPEARTNNVWGNRWFGGGSVGGLRTFFATGGPTDGPASYTRKIWEGAPGGNGDTGFDLAPALIPTTAGTRIAVSGWLRPSVGGKIGGARINWFRADQTFITTDFPTDELPANVWTRKFVSAVAPTDAAFFQPIVDIGAGTVWKTNDWLDGTGGLVEIGATTAGRWFSGGGISSNVTSPPPARGAFTYAWSDAADGSLSTERQDGALTRTNRAIDPGFRNPNLNPPYAGTLSPGLYPGYGKHTPNGSTAAGAAEDSFFLASISPLKSNTTYTIRANIRILRVQQGPFYTAGTNRLRGISVFYVNPFEVNSNSAPNEVGEYTITLTFTTSTDTPQIRLYNGSSNAADVVEWGKITITEAPGVGVAETGATTQFSGRGLFTDVPPPVAPTPTDPPQFGAGTFGQGVFGQ